MCDKRPDESEIIAALMHAIAVDKCFHCRLSLLLITEGYDRTHSGKQLVAGMFQSVGDIISSIDPKKRDEFAEWVEKFWHDKQWA